MKPFAAPKPQPKKALNIDRCSHVLNGAVWCQECASANLRWHRNEVNRLIKAEASERKIQGAKKRYAEAFEEFVLTPHGIQELERRYAEVAAKSRSDGEATLAVLAAKRNEIIQRNRSARRLAAHERMVQSLGSLGRDYVLPPRNEAGNICLTNVRFQPTDHCSTRMAERNISKDQILSLHESGEYIFSTGRGTWKVMDSNGVTACGFFQQLPERPMIFVATTTYISDMEKLQVNGQMIRLAR